MSKPLLCPKCGHRNSQHIYVVIHHSKALSEDAISCEACECLNYNTTEENLRAVKRSKPPRTNIDKTILDILGDHWADSHPVNPTDFECQECVTLIKQTLLTYIKELVGPDESVFDAMNPEAVNIDPAREGRKRVRNQLRQEILRKAEEKLG